MHHIHLRSYPCPTNLPNAYACYVSSSNTCTFTANAVIQKFEVYTTASTQLCAVKYLLNVDPNLVEHATSHRLSFGVLDRGILATQNTKQT